MEKVYLMWDKFVDWRKENDMDNVCVYFIISNKLKILEYRIPRI